MEFSKCRFCGAPIRWERTKKGNWMPCEPGAIYYTPDRSGDIYVLTNSGNVIKARKGAEPGQPTYVGFIPHWAVCTKSKAGLERKRRIDGERKAAAIRRKKEAQKAKEEAEIIRKAEEINERYRQEQRQKQLSFLPDDFIGWGK